MVQEPCDLMYVLCDSYFLKLQKLPIKTKP